MKQLTRRLSVLLLVLMVLSSSVAVWAAIPDVEVSQKVVDLADMLTDDDEADISAQIVLATAATDIDYVIFIYNDDSIKNLQQYAEDFYDINGYGIGPEYDGVLMYINMGTRDVDMIVCGRPNAIFTPSVQDRVMDVVIPYLSNGDYLTACHTFVADTMERVFDSDTATVDRDYAALERQLDAEERGMTVGSAFGISLLIALGFTGIQALRQKSSMKSAPGVGTYYGAEGLKMTLERDTFVNTVTTKTPIPKDTGSSGGSGGAHRSSSGKTFSGGGGRKF